MAFDLKNANKDELMIFAGLGVLAYILYKGGVQGAASAAASGIANAVTGAVTGAATGAVDGAGQGFGLPALSDNTIDPFVSRYIMDDSRGGYWKASEYSSAAAFAKALTMDAGSGHPPPANTALAQLFPPIISTGGAGGGW